MAQTIEVVDLDTFDVHDICLSAQTNLLNATYEGLVARDPTYQKNCLSILLPIEDPKDSVLAQFGFVLRAKSLPLPPDPSLLPRISAQATQLPHIATRLIKSLITRLQEELQRQEGKVAELTAANQQIQSVFESLNEKEILNSATLGSVERHLLETSSRLCKEYLTPAIDSIHKAIQLLSKTELTDGPQWHNRYSSTIHDAFKLRQPAMQLAKNGRRPLANLRTDIEEYASCAEQYYTAIAQEKARRRDCDAQDILAHQEFMNKCPHWFIECVDRSLAVDRAARHMLMSSRNYVPLGDESSISLGSVSIIQNPLPRSRLESREPPNADPVPLLSLNDANNTTPAQNSRLSELRQELINVNELLDRVKAESAAEIQQLKRQIAAPVPDSVVAELTRLREDVSERETALTEARGEVARMRQSMKTLEERTSELQRDLEQANVTSRDLQEVVAEREAALADSRRRVEAFQATARNESHEDRSSQIQKLEHEVEYLRKELTIEKLDCRGLKSQLSAIKTQLSASETTVTNLRGEVEKLRESGEASVATLARVKELEERLAAETASAARCQQELRKSRLKVEELMHINSQLDEQIGVAKKKLSVTRSFEEHSHTLSADLRAAREALANETQARKRSEDRVKVLELDAEVILEHRRLSGGSSGSGGVSVQELREQLSNQTTLIEQMSQQATVLERKSQEKDAQIAALKADCDTHNKRIRELVNRAINADPVTNSDQFRLAVEQEVNRRTEAHHKEVANYLELLGREQPKAPQSDLQREVTKQVTEAEAVYMGLMREQETAIERKDALLKEREATIEELVAKLRQNGFEPYD